MNKKEKMIEVSRKYTIPKRSFFLAGTKNVLIIFGGSK